jgi:Tol biopolymer transport system component
VAGNNTGEIANIDWMDKEGKFQPLHLPPADYRDPRISPDGKKLALIVRDRKLRDVWVYDWDRDTFSRVTFSGYNSSPVWTPDGRHIVYSSAQDSSQANLYWVNSDGTGAPQRLTQDKSQQLAYSVSKDGKFLAFEQLDYVSKTGRDIWTLSLEGSDKPGWKPPQPQVFLNSPFFEASPAFSQDGRWLAYSSDDTGTTEIYVRPFPGSGGKYQVSNGGGVNPIWSKDGKQLFYRTLREPFKMMVANFRVVNGGFQNDKPQEWSPGTIENRGYTTWSSDLSPDGKRFAVLKAPEVTANSGIKNNNFILILNAFDDLRRKSTAAKP